MSPNIRRTNMYSVETDVSTSVCRNISFYRVHSTEHSFYRVHSQQGKSNGERFWNIFTHLFVHILKHTH